MMRLIALIFMLTLLSCQKEKDPVLPDNLITLTHEKDNSISDDYDQNKIVVSIDKDYINLVPTVTVSTNLGTFVNTVLTFNDDGKTYAYLKSSKAGTADVIVSAKGRNFSVSSHFGSLPNYITLTSVKDSSAADDYEYNKILVKIDPLYLNPIPSVSVTTSLGTLLSNTINFNASGQGYIYLKSSQTGTANITVTMKSVNYYIDSKFITAYPSSLNINIPASMQNKLSTKLSMSIILHRSFGKVSTNLPVVIVAKDALGNSKGIFNNFTLSDANQSVSGEYWLQDTVYTGYINFTAAVLKGPLDTVAKGTNKVLIVK